MGDRSKTKNLNALQIASVVDLLRKHFEKDKGVYHDGWNDQRVANEVKASNAGQIAHLRTQHFGHLAGTGGVKSKLAQDVEQLLKLLGELQADFLQLATIVRNMPNSPMSQAMLKALQDKYHHAKPHEG